MKVEEAVQRIIGQPEPIAALRKLWREELDARLKMRSHGKTPTNGAMSALMVEMRAWTEKVAAKAGLSLQVSFFPEVQRARLRENDMETVKRERIAEIRRRVLGAVRQRKDPRSAITTDDLDILSETDFAVMMEVAREARNDVGMP